MSAYLGGGAALPRRFITYRVTKRYTIAQTVKPNIPRDAVMPTAVMPTISGRLCHVLHQLPW